MRTRGKLLGLAAISRTGTVIISALVMLVILTACAPSASQMSLLDTGSDELTGVMKSGTLIIATDPDYPPQSQLMKDAPREANTHCDNTQYTANQLSGFDVAVAVEIARRLGVEPCFVTPTWSQIISGNWGDRWHVDVGSMVITPDRMEKLYFTQPYISGEAVLFVNKANTSYHQLADLSGKRIGVCAGCAYEAYLRGTLKIPGQKIDYVIKNATIVGYDTDTSALADLSAGDGTHLDAVLTDPDTGRLAMRDGMAIKRVGDVVYHDFSAVAIDKSSSADPLPLLNKITEIIQAMHKDGTLLKLSQKYYGGDFTTPAAKFDINAIEQTR